MSRSSSKSSSSAGTNSSPWSTVSVSSDARSERQAQLAKLLEALNKKNHASTAGGSEGNKQIEQDEKKHPKHATHAPHPAHASTASSASRAAAAAASAAAAGEAAAAAKRKLMATRGSRPTSATSGGTSRLPPTPTTDDAAREYKSQLLESRGQVDAKSHAARGESAIERGASVHARGANELGQIISQSPSSSARSHPMSSASPSGFTVAAGGSMEDRALLRAYRKQQIAEAHALAEERRRQEAEQREREERERIEAIKQAELQRKRDIRRAEHEAAQAKVRAAELESQKALLAALHHQRARLVYFGWSPWRRLIEAARIRSMAMRQHAAERAKVRFFRRWLAGAAITREQRAAREERKMAKAGRYYLRRVARIKFRQWFRAVLRRRKDEVAKERYYLRRLLRSSFLAFRSTCASLKHSRAVRHARLDSRITSLSHRVVQHFYFSWWLRGVEVGRNEKASRRKKELVKEKVGGWLEEFRAQRARERGELNNDTTTTTSEAFATKLRLDLPSSASAPSYTNHDSSVVSPSHYSSIGAALASASLSSPSRHSHAVNRFEATLSPRSSATRYSTFDHPSTRSQATPTSPSHASSDASTAAAARPNSYAKFMSSPRAAVDAIAPSPSSARRMPIDEKPIESHSIGHPSLRSPRFQSTLSSSTRDDLVPSTSFARTEVTKPPPRASSSSHATPAVSSSSKSIENGPSSVALKSVLSPTSKFDRARSASSHKKGSSSSSASSHVAAPLSGSNLSSTIVRKQVTFDSGVDDLNQTEPTPIRTTPTVINNNAAGDAAMTPATAGHPTSNFSLIASAKAKAMELDQYDDDSAVGGVAFPSHPFNFGVGVSSGVGPHRVSSVASPGYADDSFDDGVDSFDRQLELVLAKTQPAVNKIMPNRERPTSSTSGRTSRNTYATTKESRTTFDEPINYSPQEAPSGLHSFPSPPTSTWSSQHANPSVSLAAARAARREQAAAAARK